MIYGSTLSWEVDNNEMIHVLNEKVSTDGHNWNHLGLACEYEMNVAQAFSRPTILMDNELNMAYVVSYRCGTGRTYRIGYAYRANGTLKWTRKIKWQE